MAEVAGADAVVATFAFADTGAFAVVLVHDEEDAGAVVAVDDEAAVDGAVEDPDVLMTLDDAVGALLVVVVDVDEDGVDLLTEDEVDEVDDEAEAAAASADGVAAVLVLVADVDAVEARVCDWVVA